MNQSFIANVIRKYSDVIIKRGRGSYVYGHDNKQYLDFTSGIGVLSLGHSNKRVNNMVKRQMKNYVHSQQMCLSNYPAIKLCETISTITPDNLNVTYLCNSGTDAVDSALRIARYATGKKIILSLPNGYHGRSLGVSALTENIPERKKVTPFVGSSYISENVFSQLDNCGNNIAAVIIEPIQGEGGIYQFDKEFMQRLRQKCTYNDILLIADEVQCGISRSGEMFAFSRSKIVPDIILTGKGLGNGYPIAAVTSTKEIFNKCPIGSIGNTYGANALSVAAAQTTLDIIKDDFITEKVNKDETMIIDWANKEESVIDVRIYGLMVGLVFEQPVERLRQICLKNGLLTLPTRNPNMLRLLPSLNISEKHLKIGLDILSMSMYENTKHLNI